MCWTRLRDVQIHCGVASDAGSLTVQQNTVTTRPRPKDLLDFQANLPEIVSGKGHHHIYSFEESSRAASGRVYRMEVRLRPRQVLSEVRRVLQGLYPFRYDHDGSPALGIALAEVKTGDFVFRAAQVASQKGEQGEPMPPISGLIIRPYQASAVGLATFRLVGMCFAYYPDLKEPELVEVVLV